MRAMRQIGRGRVLRRRRLQERVFRVDPRAAPAPSQRVASFVTGRCPTRAGDIPARVSRSEIGSRYRVVQADTVQGGGARGRSKCPGSEPARFRVSMNRGAGAVVQRAPRPAGGIQANAKQTLARDALLRMRNLTRQTPQEGDFRTRRAACGERSRSAPARQPFFSGEIRHGGSCTL